MTTAEAIEEKLHNLLSEYICAWEELRDAESSPVRDEEERDDATAECSRLREAIVACALPSGTVVDLGVWKYEQASWAGQAVPELVRIHPDGQIDSLIVDGDALRLIWATGNLQPNKRYRARLVLEEVDSND